MPPPGAPVKSNLTGRFEDPFAEGDPEPASAAEVVAGELVGDRHRAAAAIAAALVNECVGLGLVRAFAGLEEFSG